MYLPEGVSEADFLTAATKVINILSRSFAFGYHEPADMRQQAMIFAIKCMPKYDVSRPLENFLYRHVRNRLINFRRDNFRRNDAPCPQCYNSIQGHTAHADGKYCPQYEVWLRRNTTKQNIMNPADITNINDEQEPNTRSESDIVDSVALQEIIDIIDMKLPVELRSAWLQMQDTSCKNNVPKAKRLQVENAVKQILKENQEWLTPSESEMNTNVDD